MKRKHLFFLVGVLTLGSISICYFKKIYYIGKVQEALESGYPAVGAFYADKIIISATDKKESCELLISTYHQAGLIQKGNLVAQACLFHKVNTPLAYLLIATYQEQSGYPNRAIKLLEENANKFPKNPDLFYKAYQIAIKAKLFSKAIDLMEHTSSTLPADHTIQLEALNFYYTQNAFVPMVKLAQKLQNLNVHDIKFNLLMAHAFRILNDENKIHSFMSKAKVLINKLPADERKVINEKYLSLLRE